MRAVLCKAFGPPESLVIEEVEDPVARPGEVIVDVVACGVNFPDVLTVAGKYQSLPPFPFSPGGEIAGVVRSLGAGVGSVRVGDAVIAGVGTGGFAEQVAVRASAVRAVPAGMSLTTAAGITTTYGTSYYALKQRGRLQPGETLLVTGAAGGVGLAAVEIGAAMGARVIAAASSSAKLDVARAAGATDLVDYSDGELKEKVKALTGGKGADVIYDPVGGDALFDQCMRCVNWNGRVLVIGFLQGIPRVPTNLALLKGCEIVGVFYGAWTARDPAGAAANMRELQQMFETGTLRPHIGATLPMERYAEALRLLEERRAIGKVVLQIRPDRTA